MRMHNWDIDIIQGTGSLHYDFLSLTFVRRIKLSYVTIMSLYKRKDTLRKYYGKTDCRV